MPPGAEANTVFETEDDQGSEAVRVDKLYTYNGYHTLFLDRIGSIAEQLDSESWVLGKYADKGGKEPVQAAGPGHAEEIQ